MLTTEQERAACHIGGPMLVTAGPGSGKTRVLTERLQRLLKVTAPERIVVITFTRKAAREMKQRFAAMTDRETADRVNFGTFHSFFLKLLNEWLGKGWMEYPALSLRQGDGETFDYDRIMTEMDHQVNFHRVYEDYDFFLVDEFQDIDPLQYSILRRMVAPPGKTAQANLFVVGDEDQAIYAFRGSDPNIFLHLPEDFPGCQRVHLSRNFRSNGDIVKAASRLIRHNEQRFPKNFIHVHPGEVRSILIYDNYDERMEAQQIAHTVIRRHGRGTPYKQMAILARSGSQLKRITEALQEGGIPYRTKPEWNGHSHHPVILRREMKKILHYAKNPESVESAQKILSLFHVYAKYGSLSSIDREGKKDQEDLLYRMVMASEAEIEIKEEAKLLHDCFLQLPKEKRLRDVYRHILWNTDYGQGALQRLKDHGWGELAFLRQVKRLFIPAKEGVYVMTMHAAKGLEFDEVFIAGMVEGVTPHQEGEMEEERRLCYVAMTRARHKLHLFTYHDHEHQPSRFLREIREDRGFQ